MSTLLAVATPGVFQTVAFYAIVIVAICGVVALAWIAMRAMGIQPPGWFIQALWVLAIVAVIILLIKVLVYVVISM